MAGIINVTDMAHTRSFPINGTPVTVKDVVADFLGQEPARLNITGKTIRLVNYGEVTNDLNRQLKNGDTITIFETGVANGGVKGAAQDGFRS